MPPSFATTLIQGGILRTVSACFKRPIHHTKNINFILFFLLRFDGEWSNEAADKNALNGDLGLVLKSKAKHAAISSRSGH